MHLIFKLPPKSARPNGRVHFYQKAKVTKHLKQVAILRTRQAIGFDYHAAGREVPAFTGYALDFYFPKDIWDDDNADASFKAYRDGIAHALGIDDRILRKSRLSTYQIDQENPRLEVTLYATPHPTPTA